LVTELARKIGVEVTALARATASYQRLRELGASVVFSLADASGPFEVVFESVGGAVMGEAVRKLGRRGLVLWFGEASGQPVPLVFN
jgi:NADPH:quinone reductase